MQQELGLRKLREPVEKRSVSLTATQWAWLEERSFIEESRSQSAVLRRLIEDARAKERQEALVA